MALGTPELLILGLILLFLVVPLVVVLLSGRRSRSTTAAAEPVVERPLRPPSQAEMIATADAPLGDAERLDGTSAPVGGGIVGSGLAPSAGLAPSLDHPDDEGED